MDIPLLPPASGSKNGARTAAAAAVDETWIIITADQAHRDSEIKSVLDLPPNPYALNTFDRVLRVKMNNPKVILRASNALPHA